MEEKLSIIENVNGHTYDTIYDLIFTTERVIVVVIKHPLDIPVTFGVSEMFVGKWATSKADKIGQYNIAEERRRQINEKSLKEIISAHRFNFEIPYNDVKSVRLKKGLIKTRLEFKVDMKDNVYNIRYSIPKRLIPDVTNILEQVLAQKMK